MEQGVEHHGGSLPRRLCASVRGTASRGATERTASERAPTWVEDEQGGVELERRGSLELGSLLQLAVDSRGREEGRHGRGAELPACCRGEEEEETCWLKEEERVVARGVDANFPICKGRHFYL
jgi:hypothetical protein